MEAEKSIIIIHDVNFRGQHIRVSWCKDYDFNRRSPLVSRGVRCNWGAEGKETVEIQGLLHSPSKTESSGKSVELVGHLRHSHNTCQSRFPVHSWGIWYAGQFRHYGFSVSLWVYLVQLRDKQDSRKRIWFLTMKVQRSCSPAVVTTVVDTVHCENLITIIR